MTTATVRTSKRTSMSAEEVASALLGFYNVSTQLRLLVYLRGFFRL